MKNRRYRIEKKKKRLDNGNLRKTEPFFFKNFLLQALALACQPGAEVPQLELLNLAAGGFGVVGGLEYVFGYWFYIIKKKFKKRGETGGYLDSGSIWS